MTATLAGWLAIDDHFDLVIWGAGKTEKEACEDAWKWLCSQRPREGAALSYYEATQAVLDYVAKNGGGDGLPLKFFRHNGGDCVALKDEEVETRCPHTADMFAKEGT